MSTDARVAVVGLGAFGSATLWRLAAHNIPAIGFEQFELGNAFGSSHGKTRLFRTISHDVPMLYPLSLLARELWRELQSTASETVFTQTAGIAVSESDALVGRRVKAISERYGVQVEQLSADHLRTAHRAFRVLSDDAIGFLDKGAGVLRPEAAIRAACVSAKQLGSRVLENTAVKSIESGRQNVVLRTAEQTFTVDKVIICTGAWSRQFFPSVPILVERIPQTWFTWKNGGAPSLDDLPVFQIGFADGTGLWGHGAVSADGHAKVGSSGNPLLDRRVEIDKVNRTIAEADLVHLRALMGRALPDLDPDPVEATSCILTTPPDSQFVLGPTSDTRVWAGFGGSGKGFKHAPAVGEILARLLSGDDIPVPIAYMSPLRFLA